MASRARVRKVLKWIVVIAACYGVLAYVVLPRVWSHYERQPGLASHAAVTTTTAGIPGDPLNVGFVGSKTDVILALHRAGWYPADPITLKSSLEIAGSVVFDRPYKEAPVSTLLYEGRKQDMAFEKPIGGSADRRNHVRIWKVLEKGVEDRPVWLGSATLDAGVGLNHYNGQFTHHISPDIDAERDRLIAEVIAAHMVTATYQVSGVGPTINGRNGEDDRYYTDGEIHIAVLSPDGRPVEGTPKAYESTPLIALKDGVWSSVSGWLGN